MSGAQPPEAVRVLVARPDAEARERIIVALRADPRLTVVGTARTGAETVRLTMRSRPSVVLLDAAISDPGVVDTTHEIMTTQATPIVVLAEPGTESEAAFAALDAGALSVQRDPSDAVQAGARFSSVVIALADVALVRRRAPRTSGRPTFAREVEGARVVAVAASTGGPAALQRLLMDLPGGFELPLLLVQHLPPGHTEQFVRWLDEVSGFRVALAEDGTPLKAGQVHVAPDGEHLTVTGDGSVRLVRTPPVDGFRPSATVMFTSVAEAYGSQAIGIVLSGMGNDGVTGLHALRSAGGHVIAQDEETSVVFGMPGAAVAAGVVDVVAPIGVLADRLLDAVGQATGGAT